MIKRFLYRVFCGFFLGISIFAPGISGSVVAIAMGVYQDIVRIASNPHKNIKQNILFVVPLAIGAALSAVLFVLGFKYLFETYQKATYLLFIGLIAGNLPVISREIKRCNFKRRYLFSALGAFIAAIAIVLLTTGIGNENGAETVSSGLALFALGGFAAGVTALVPGMSVSTILIVTGIYSQVIYAAESLLHLQSAYLLHLGLFGLCVLIGLVLVSRGIKSIFDEHPGFANAAVLGFVAGSLVGILIQTLRLDDPNFNWLLGAGMILAGLAVSALFLLMGKRMKHHEA
jgi:putative membrane protein